MPGYSHPSYGHQVWLQCCAMFVAFNIEKLSACNIDKLGWPGGQS